MSVHRLLSKSLYTTGLENEREMWYQSRQRLARTASDAWSMKQGQEVGAKARQRFPDGIFVGGEPRKADMRSSQPLFEAQFSANGMTARVDILHPGPHGWVIIEVKSSTFSGRDRRKRDKAKHDAAFQAFVLTQAGVDVDRVEILHLNSDYVHPGNGDLFTKMAIDLDALWDDVQTNADLFRNILQRTSAPDRLLSRDCNKCNCPEPCRVLPDQSIFTLPRLHWRNTDALLSEDRITLDEVAGHPKLKKRHTHHIQAVRSGKPFIRPNAIREILDTLTYPIHYLDFEAINYAIPRFENTKPWQHIPFQYSLHIDRGRTEDVRHTESLHDSTDDPRLDLVKCLLDDMESKGSVVVYHKTFEKRILEKLQEAYPEYASAIQHVIDRLWDQEKVFSDWHFIDPAQKGSTSIKKVLPVLAPDLDYSDLSVQDGMQAVIHYDQMIHDATPREKQDIYDDLLNYCELDTLAMVRINEELSNRL